VRHARSQWFNATMSKASRTITSRMSIAAHLALLHEGDGQLLEVAGRRRRAHEGLHLRVLNAVHVQRERAHCRPHLSGRCVQCWQQADTHGIVTSMP
jgi:hypothetical protein